MYAKDGIKAKGFTLIELLIVVIIVAILAAIVVPQFTDSSTEAKESALDANLAAMRSAVELYKIQHAGKYPGAQQSVPPTTTDGTTTTSTCSGVGGTATAAGAQAFIDQLTMATDANGNACSIASATFKYGPYLKSKVPSDPFHNKGSKPTEIVVTTDGSITNPTADTGGWKFDTLVGKLFMNSNATDSRGNFYYQH